MNELALFAGAGGGLLASKWLLGWRTICYVEIEPYAVACLIARIKDGLLDDAPIWDDARTFDGKLWNGIVDIISAGFPCQPFSVAGKRKGAKDERNLWPDTIRIVRQVRPRYVLLENVPGLLADKYVRRIFGDLAESGYDCRWRCLSAAEVGGQHIRNRLWIVGSNSTSEGNNKYLEIRTISQRGKNHTGIGCKNWVKFIVDSGDVAPSKWKSPYEEFNTEPLFVRNNNDVAKGLDRLKALGEGQVPEVVRVVWELLNNG